MLENTVPRLADKLHCTGCGACAAKCPKKCITMKVRDHVRDANAKVGTTPEKVLEVK